MPLPLYVAFVWHMHQPYYRDFSTGDFVLPWTRLHATKDYLHMAEVLDDFPTIHVTFNLVPSLIEQLEDYAGGESTDQALRISLKHHLSSADKEFLLSFFFSINEERVIKRYPPYHELLVQRQEAQGDWRRFADQYWTDLIVWFNLAWFDPGHVQRDPDLKALLEKGRGFTRADLELIVEKSRRIAGPTLAAYRRLAEHGQVELTTSPYYHPILPLLIDSTSAHEATPAVALPPTLFAYPEDAVEQIRRGLLAYERTFGHLPRGMWPPEGAVSQDTAELIAHHTDLRWIASDEAILARSLNTTIERDAHGHLIDPHMLYQPYAIHTKNRTGDQPLVIVFRDRLLSDRIGFVYQHMDSQAAAEDLVHRLHHIAETLGDADQPGLVSIILDGENCWEYYENNGDDFLRHLYGLLADDRQLKTTTVSEYLDAYPPRQIIEHLAAGSWIGGDMLTWIGEPAQNQAWDALARTRERLVSRAANDRSTSLDVIGYAWQELYIAQGSDWFWWYSTRNNPNTDAFDVLFRGHLAEVYRNLGLPVPDWLMQPIKVSRPLGGVQAPIAQITPELTASPQLAPAWAHAGYLEPDLSTGTMQRGEALLRRLYYGHDDTFLYLRLETTPTGPVSTIVIYFSVPRGRSNRSVPMLPQGSGDVHGWSYELTLTPPAHTVHLRRADGYEQWQDAQAAVAAVFGQSVVEVRLTLSDLNLRLGDGVGLVVVLGRNSVIEERHPATGLLSFRLRSGHPPEQHWVLE